MNALFYPEIETDTRSPLYRSDDGLEFNCVCQRQRGDLPPQAKQGKRRFSHNICKSPAKVTAISEVTEAHDRIGMTPTKIELAK
jgi:hypothetical protein